MLIEFCVGNYGPFKDEACLDLMATSAKELKRNLIELPSYRPRKKPLYVNKAVAIYGANASGKSSFVYALVFMRDFVLNSAKKYDSGDLINVDPFMLDMSLDGKPTSFEVVFMVSGVKYRYGFEATIDKVVSEWLFYSPKGIERSVFVRKGDHFEFPKGKSQLKEISKYVRDNSLFVSAASQLNAEIVAPVVGWFKNLLLYTPVHSSSTSNLISRLCSSDVIDVLSECLAFADTGIDSVIRTDVKSEEDLLRLAKERELSDDEREYILKALENAEKGIYRLDFMHRVYRDGELLDDVASFPLDDESVGTIKFLALMALTINAMTNGGVVVVDEFDASMHPALAVAFLKIFHNVCSDRAQLIFTTHNIHLLRSHSLRRDQVWLSSKDRYGASHLDCVSDFKVRNDADISKLYMDGKLGGMPLFSGSRMRRIINTLCEIVEGSELEKVPHE